MTHDAERLRIFDEGSVNRDPLGQFAKEPEPKRPPAKPKRREKVGPASTMGYDPATRRGTGYGSRDGDERVRTLQQALNRLGLTDSRGRRLKVDGKLGPLTTQAVKAAQRRMGAKADGKVTPDFLTKVTSAKSAPTKGRSVEHIDEEFRRDVPGMCTRAFDFDTPPGDGRTLEGYAAVFGHSARISAHGGDFDEEIMPGAFTRSLAARTPVLLFDHGKDPRIGGAPIGTIDGIAEDSKGLHVRARLFEHSDIDRIREPIAKGAIKGMSFRFQVPDKGDKWEPGRHRGGYDKRSILDADVYEVGPVVFPAYDQTTVSVRSLLSTMGADEIRALAHELAAHLGLAVDLEDSTGRPGARSAGGGEEGDEDQEADVPTLSSTNSRQLDEAAFRALGVLTP